MINIGEENKEKIEKVKLGRTRQYTRRKIIEITSKRFCERHNVKSIKEYQKKVGDID